MYKYYMIMPEDKFFKFLGSQIARARKESNVSQVELAKKMNIPQSSLAYYESGKRRIPASLLYEITSILNIDINEFFPVRKTKPGPVSKIDKELNKVKSLPESQQRLIINLIQSVINNPKAS